MKLIFLLFCFIFICSCALKKEKIKNRLEIQNFDTKITSYNHYNSKCFYKYNDSISGNFNKKTSTNYFNSKEECRKRAYSDLISACEKKDRRGLTVYNMKVFFNSEDGLYLVASKFCGKESYKKYTTEKKKYFENKRLMARKNALAKQKKHHAELSKRKILKKFLQLLQLIEGPQYKIINNKERILSVSLKGFNEEYRHAKNKYSDLLNQKQKYDQKVSLNNYAGSISTLFQYAPRKNLEIKNVKICSGKFLAKGSYVIALKDSVVFYLDNEFENFKNSQLLSFNKSYEIKSSKKLKSFYFLDKNREGEFNLSTFENDENGKVKYRTTKCELLNIDNVPFDYLRETVESINKFIGNNEKTKSFLDYYNQNLVSNDQRTEIKRNYKEFKDLNYESFFKIPIGCNKVWKNHRSETFNKHLYINYITNKMPFYNLTAYSLGESNIKEFNAKLSGSVDEEVYYIFPCIYRGEIDKKASYAINSKLINNPIYLEKSKEFFAKDYNQKSLFTYKHYGKEVVFEVIYSKGDPSFEFNNYTSVKGEVYLIKKDKSRMKVGNCYSLFESEFSGCFDVTKVSDLNNDGYVDFIFYEQNERGVEKPGSTNLYLSKPNGKYKVFHIVDDGC